MKRTIAVIGSAAALTLAGAGIASAEPNGDDAPTGPSDIATQICDGIDTVDLLGSAEGVAPGLSGEDCAVNADAAIAAAMSFDFGEVLDIIRGDVNGEDGENADDDDENLDPEPDA